MITENLSTLKIYKLTQEQYDKRVLSGNIDENGIYLTPDEEGYTNAEIDSRLDELQDTLDGSITSLSVSGKTITYTKNDGTTGTITTQDTNTDTKVNQAPTVTSNYRPVVLGTTNSTDTSTLAEDVTGAVNVTESIYAQPSTGTLFASTFKGALDGNAATATKLGTSAGSATQPVYFSDGKPVATTYTLGKSVPSDAVFTDTNTKNTAGSTNSSSKLFLIGATTQAANPQTYSHDTAYVGTDGHLYSDSKQVVNLSSTQALTNKTYNGYTLAAACAKDVSTSVTSGSANLVTSGAVYTAIDIDYTKIQFDTTEIV